MHLFNSNLKLTKYNTVHDIINEYYSIRLEYYEKRRQFMIKKLKHELKILENKMRFINEYISGILDINKKSKDYTLNLLKTREYFEHDNFGYLVNLPIISFTKEKLNDLQEQLDTKKQEYEYYINSTDKSLWKEDLDNLIKLF